MTTSIRGERSHGRRGQVLQLLRDINKPLGSTEIADRLGIHTNTVRFHLETLVDNGQVERTHAPAGTPGRPAQLFQVVRGMDPMGPRHYRGLAEALAATLAAEPDLGRRALEAGRVWGRVQASAPANTPRANTPSESLGAETTASVGRLTRMLDEMGFAPEQDDAGGPLQIGLRNCPFLELAVEHAEVVCPIHLGLMQGAVQTWGAPVTVDRLDPFVEPDLCVVRLSAVGVA